LTLFTPLPLILCGLYFTRVKAYSTGLIWTLVVYLVLSLLESIGAGEFNRSYILGGYIFFWGIAVLITEVIHRVKTAEKALFVSGISVFLFTVISSHLYLMQKNKTANEFVLEKVVETKKQLEEHQQKIMQDGGESGIEFLNMFKEPEKLVETIMDNIYVVVFIGSFVLSWINLITIPWASSFFSPMPASFYIRRLVLFRVPDYCVWIVISLLLMLILGQQMGLPNIEQFAYLGLPVMGLFYFFQGFGLYYQFIHSIQINRFFRTLLLLLMVTAAYKFLAIIGFLDVWINFRKYLVKKKLSK
jgi:hypothetical protein